MEYKSRRADTLLPSLLSELPAILITGPRAAGKTTTAKRHAKSIVRLDVPAEGGVFRADPDAALRGLPEPILLDEWQAVPEVLGAVKRAVDADSSMGRFILTGSVWADFDGQPWPGTGRIVRTPLFGLTVCEQHGDITAPTFFDRVVEGHDLHGLASALDLREYVRLALVGGFPDAVFPATESGRRRWLSGYVESLVTRDIPQLSERRDPARLRRFLRSYALSTAGFIRDTSLLEAAGINYRTADAYERLFADIFIVDLLPAWSTNRLKRLVKSPKRYLVDSSLVGAILGLDEGAIMKDANMLGRLLDTFVMSQLRAEEAYASHSHRFYHLRNTNGSREVDVIVELANGDIIGIEIKAAAAPNRNDAQHLMWLRDEIGDRFVRGIVLHTGPRAFILDEKIIAAPISALWKS